MNFFSRHRKALHRLLLLVVFIAIGLYVVDNLEQLKGNPVHFRWEYLAYGLIFTLLGHLASYGVWMRIAASFDMRTSWPHAGKAWFLSRLGRYIPGKISILLMRFNAYEGHSKTKISAATIIEAYTSLCAASLLLLFFVFTTSSTITPSIPSVVMLVILLLALSHPKAMQFALGLAGKILTIPTLYSLPRQRDNLAFAAAQLLTMLLHGGALFMIFNAIGQVDAEHYLLVTAAFFIASLIGMMAVFAPSGIGVREAALFVMLTNHIDPATLLIGAVLIRLVGIVSELILSSFFVAYEKIDQMAAH